MKRYRYRRNKKIAVVSEERAAGMCKHTIGMTIVVYKYEEDNYDYSFVMEHREFYDSHDLID